MEEFLRQNYHLFTAIIESLAAVTGVFLLRKYKLTAAKYFIYFLVYLTICDISSFYTRYVAPGKFFEFLIGTVFEKNHWWSTLFWSLGAIAFFGFYYNKILENFLFKKIVKYTCFTFLIFSSVYIGLNWGRYFDSFFPVISIFGAVVIFICAVLYFIETLQSDKILTFYKSINFYISLAIFIWWLIITPLTFYDVLYLKYEVGNPNRDWSFIFLRWEIYLFANIFMYLTYTFALIWCKPENN